MLLVGSYVTPAATVVPSALRSENDVPVTVVGSSARENLAVTGAFRGTPTAASAGLSDVVVSGGDVPTTVNVQLNGSQDGLILGGDRSRKRCGVGAGRKGCGRSERCGLRGGVVAHDTRHLTRGTSERVGRLVHGGGDQPLRELGSWPHSGSVVGGAVHRHRQRHLGRHRTRTEKLHCTADDSGIPSRARTDAEICAV